MDARAELPCDDQLDVRILVAAPTGRDGQLAARVLKNAGLLAHCCPDLIELTGEARRGAGALLLTEEGLNVEGLNRLIELLDDQPPWSDLPIAIFTGGGLTTAHAEPLEALRQRGNVTLLERPIRVATLVSTMQAALRGRRRQYEVRDLLAQLENGVRQRDEFLAMLAHELRNPLAAISSATRLLHEMAPPTAQVQPIYSVLDRQTRQMTRLIDDLLDVSRVTSGKIVLKKQTVNVVDIARRSLQAVQAAIDQRQHVVTLSLPREPVMVEGDPVRLEQVFTNLLTNAVKYTPEAGIIEISVGRVDDEAVLSVRDNGLGITPENLPHIFGLFQQAERALDRAQGGLGVGLTVVASLVEMHGGTVGAHSDGLGHGSEFTVRLPCSASPAPVAAPLISHPVVRSLRILLVEDNPDVRTVLEICLARKGHVVEVAPDGPTAMEKAMTLAPEIALIDIGLPGIDGYQVAQSLRDQITSPLYLVALTGYGQPGDRSRALEAGFDLHLTKPLDLDQLDDVLSRVNGHGPAAVPQPAA